MTEIKLYWEQGFLRGIESQGHSDFSDKGSDIVCAAVSSLMNALILGLSDVANIKELDGEIDPEVPVIKIFWPLEKAESIDILTRTIALSLKKLIKDNFYDEYVKITEVEL